MAISNSAEITYWKAGGCCCFFFYPSFCCILPIFRHLTWHLWKLNQGLCEIWARWSFLQSNPTADNLAKDWAHLPGFWAPKSLTLNSSLLLVLAFYIYVSEFVLCYSFWRLIYEFSTYPKKKKTTFMNFQRNKKKTPDMACTKLPESRVCRTSIQPSLALVSINACAWFLLSTSLFTRK